MPASAAKEPSAIVIANCHCLPLADALALGGRVRDTDFIDVVFTERPEVAAKIAALTAPDGPDIVFSFPLLPHFGALATEALRPLLGARLSTFTNIHFEGLHPDMTYLGQMKHRLTGYFGDYHSKIVVFCFATGRSAADAKALFKGKFYRQLGYFDSFAAAAAEMRRREQFCDIKFAETFLQMIQQEPCLYTINHPSGHVFAELAAAMAAHRHIKFSRHHAGFFQNHLADAYIWPVYREIAEEHSLPYRTVQHFIQPARRGRRGVDLSEFIAGCYAAYAEADPAEFRAAVEALPFFSRFAELL